MPRSGGNGFFSGYGSGVMGKVGPLLARWDRHRGGALTMALRRGRDATPAVEVSTVVRLLKEQHPWLATQLNDPNPRLIHCEEGPERLVMRAMYALLDERGAYHGDGVCDAVLWSNGDIHLAFALRLVDLTAHDQVSDAYVQMRLPGVPEEVEVGTRPRRGLRRQQLATRDHWFALPGEVPARYIFARVGRIWTAFAWFDNAHNCYPSLGGVGAWAGPRDEPPFYDRWGHLYDQWGGEAGWREESACLGLVPTEDGLALRWYWLRGANQATTPNTTFRILLAVRFREEGRLARGRTGRVGAGAGRSRSRSPALQALRQEVAAFQNPLVPLIRGGEFRCLDLLENALVVRRTDRTTRLVFRRDRLARTVHVRLYGLKGTGAVVVSAPGERIVPHLLSHGGITDDPYGPNHARPGDRHYPLVADPTVPPDEVVFSVTLSPRARTVVTVREGEGIGLAYLKWDDRRCFVVRSSGVDGPVGLLSLRTLCLHDVRARGGAPPALVRLPFYWYLCNAPSPFHCLNLLEEFRLTENGPERLRFEVVAHNRGGRARSTVAVEFPRVETNPLLHARARLDILRQWDLETIQYLNCFPENSWQPADWRRDWVLLMDADGRTTTYFFKERLPQKRTGDPITLWRNSLVLVQGAAEGQNIIIYVRNIHPENQQHDYRLCRVWLDSHFSIVFPEAPVTGGCFEVAYSVAVGGDWSLTRAKALEIARRVLAEGLLDPTWLSNPPRSGEERGD